MTPYRFVRNQTEYENLPVEKQNHLYEQAHKLACKDWDLAFWGFIFPLPVFAALSMLVYALLDGSLARSMLSVLSIGPIISFGYAFRFRENYHLLVLLRTTAHAPDDSDE